MCDFSRKLIAWLDHELQDSEAVEVERHVAACAECRGKVAAYEKIGGAIADYCDEIVLAEERRKAQLWVPVVAAIAAIAVVAIVLNFPRTRAHINRQDAPAGGSRALASPPVSAPVVAETRVEPARKTRQRHIRTAATREAVNSSAGLSSGRASEDAPSVEIAIPAGALFPPGVFPEGVSFVADLSVAADGSARGVRLQPAIVLASR